MSRLLRRRQVGLTALTAALVAIILYWPALRLPLLYDDLLHIRITTGLNLATVWLPTEAFGFYRPLTFLPLLIIQDLFGYYPAWLLHGLNVAQHALNVALLVALSWRFWRDWVRALAAGLLLALFPFAYQAIAVYGHNVHPTTAGLMLLGLHTYLSGVEQRKTRWWLLTGLLFFLSLLSHETAVLFGLFAALVHLSYRRKPIPHTCTCHRRCKCHPSPVPRYPLPSLPFLLLGALYALIYQTIPISRALPGANSDSGLWLKALYLAQAAAHPITWFAHLLPNLDAVAIVLGGMIITLGLTAWSARARANRPPLLLGWGWWGLASLLLLLSLPSGYLLHGPRLLYLGGVGLALLWPVLLDPLRRLPGVGWLLWMAALGFILLTGWGFVRGRLNQYAQLTSPVVLMEKVMADRPPNEGILLVNLPAWLAPPRNTYPVGAEHVAMLGHYLFLEELVAENTRVNRPARAIKLPELLDEPDYPYSIFGETDLSQPIPADWAPAGSQVFVVSYAAGGVHPQHVGQLSPSTEEQRPVARFGPYQLLEAEVVNCDGAVQATTRWRWTEDQPPPATVSLFVQLLDESGRLIAQADSALLGLRPDLISPAPGWEITDLRTLRPAGGRPARLLLGVYDFVSVERFPAYDEENQRLPDDALILPVQ